MDNDKTNNPFTPINPIENAPVAPEGYRSPNFGVVEAIIEEGLKNAAANNAPSVKVEVDGKQKFLSRFLAGDVYKYGLSDPEIQDLLDRYLYAKVVGEYVTYPATRRAELGHLAARAVDDYDFRERQAGEHLDND